MKSLAFVGLFILALILIPPLKSKITEARTGMSATALAQIARNGLAGTYTMDRTVESALGTVTLSMLFLDRERVQLLGNGKPWGQNNGMCSYKVNGDTVVLTHYCGVDELQIRGATLLNKQTSFTYYRNK